MTELVHGMATGYRGLVSWGSDPTFWEQLSASCHCKRKQSCDWSRDMHIELVNRWDTKELGFFAKGSRHKKRLRAIVLQPPFYT